MMTPDHNDLDVRVLLHVIAGEKSVHHVAEKIRRSPDTALRALRRLRESELVTWEPPARGTLRPNCQVVAFGPVRDRKAVERSRAKHPSNYFGPVA